MPQIQKLIVLYARRYFRKDRPGEEQIHWMKLGVAWQKPDAIDMVLYAMPPADTKGEIRFTLKPDEGYDEARANRSRGNGAPARDRPQQREPGEDDDLAF
jgi:hypothetical protein